MNELKKKNYFIKKLKLILCNLKNIDYINFSNYAIKILQGENNIKKHEKNIYRYMFYYYRIRIYNKNITDKIHRILFINLTEKDKLYFGYPSKCFALNDIYKNKEFKDILNSYKILFFGTNCPHYIDYKYVNKKFSSKSDLDKFEFLFKLCNNDELLIYLNFNDLNNILDYIDKNIKYSVIKDAKNKILNYISLFN